ncbi:MAG: hypothetical protein ACI9KE_003931 [Polyangiales bacterium]|jgi:hypothetical protein
MAKFGTNMKLTVAKRYRDQSLQVFTEALGATHKQLLNGFDMFLLEDGFNIGILFVDEGGMSPSDAKDNGVWLEFAVEDKAKTGAVLKTCGVEPFDYAGDADNEYYLLPGGPVFRLSDA